MDTTPLLSWTLVQEIPVPDDLEGLLVEGESVVAAYRTFTDSAVFTSRRLVVRDAQGKKGEVWSLPYRSILMWSSEQAEDAGAKVELWTEAGLVKIRLNPEVDLRRVDALVARAVLAG